MSQPKMTDSQKARCATWIKSGQLTRHEAARRYGVSLMVISEITKSAGIPAWPAHVHAAKGR